MQEALTIAQIAKVVCIFSLGFGTIVFAIAVSATYMIRSLAQMKLPEQTAGGANNAISPETSKKGANSHDSTSTHTQGRVGGKIVQIRANMEPVGASE